MLATTILLTLLSAGPEAAACTPTDAAEVCAPATPELRARVRGMLGAIDQPVPPDAWRKLGPAAVPVLTEIATSPSELPFQRARAVEALALVGGDEATGTTLRLARETRETGEAWDVRASAVRGLGRLLPRERLVAELKPVLERDPHGNVRDAAATVLARKAGPSGCDAVRAQAEKERRPGRAPYAQALARCR
jgi:hypothetical protein